MFLIVVAIVIVGVILWKINSKPSNENLLSNDSVQGNEKALSPALQQALDNLTLIMNKCQVEHELAVLILTWLAASDGTVSRVELRIIIDFCQNQGTVIDNKLISSLDRLNSGLNISVTGKESSIFENIEALKDKPLNYRENFLGAAVAICSSNKTINAAKKRVLDKIRTLVV